MRASDPLVMELQAAGKLRFYAGAGHTQIRAGEVLIQNA